MRDFGAEALPAVVLVHGGFVDGSGWEEVYRLLREDGYSVSVVQHPTITFVEMSPQHDASSSSRMAASSSWATRTAGP